MRKKSNIKNEIKKICVVVVEWEKKNILEYHKMQLIHVYIKNLHEMEIKICRKINKKWKKKM